MALGTNRDRKTADRTARTQLAKHAEMMQRLLADFRELTRSQASALALRIMQGKEPYPIYWQNF